MRVAVVGAGIVGLATADALSRRGAEVVCLDQDEPMAARSAGNSRIFRLAHADPGLVAYAARSADLWSWWSERAGTPLVGTQGLVVTGPNAPDWATAMAGFPHTVEPAADALGLPVRSALPGPALVDPGAGVIDVPATRTFLRAAVGSALRTAHAYRLTATDDRVRLDTSAGPVEADRVVVAAGRGTWQLAAQVGVYVPTELAHHVRFTFRLRDPAAAPPCWIDGTESWRPGFTTYQQCSGPGHWSVGASLAPAEQAWERGRAAVVARSRDLVRRYVREALAGVEDDIVDELYCDLPAGLGDGVHVTTGGPATFLWGDNLFKHAPAVGESLAASTLDGTVPDIPPA
ncbi:NAD(P)/FAD-dependent oxidoreductase [Actinophytocola gossypii]|uniref:FAD-dependent oxidoreductase n=1 Tax=Actinophytocola gossypii TaxID=2812003 RepID=A0ABT2JF93_9PSEU|nr:FAD-dependent oxidoreductase [Actinophytocola gossypii]MCT2586547.1 FAD-dependent oxidoreductase [Actinophytocola gossypii]